MSSFWDRLQLELHEIVSKIEGALADQNQMDDSIKLNQENEKQVASDWLDFGVAEGDGCRRLDPPAESITDFGKGAERLKEGVHHHVPTDSERRFAMMQKIFDCLTVIKMYADIVTTDFALVKSIFSLHWFNLHQQNRKKIVTSFSSSSQIETGRTWSIKCAIGTQLML
jgi:hypothetical protein